MQNNSEIKKIEFAELLGVHRSRISQLDKIGQLVLSADGKLVNVPKSLELIIKRSTVEKTVAQARHAKSRFLKGGSSKTTAEIAKEHLEKNNISTKQKGTSTKQNIVSTKQKKAATKQNTENKTIEVVEKEEENLTAKQIAAKQNPNSTKQIELETKKNSTGYEHDKSAVTVKTASDEFNVARAKNEIRKGEQMEIEIAKAKQELVNRDSVHIVISSVASNVKSSIERLPDRLGTLLADETDPNIIYQIIQDEAISILLSLQQGIDGLIENL